MSQSCAVPKLNLTKALQDKVDVSGTDYSGKSQEALVKHRC